MPRVANENDPARDRVIDPCLEAALRLLGAIEAWGRRGVRFIEPLRRRYQPIADRLLERAGPGAPAAVQAEGAAVMAEGAAMTPAELAALALPADR